MSSEPQPGDMSVAEAIRRKRAVRSYTADAVPEDVMMSILNAGRRAQSSKNTQPWTFVLVTEREQLARLAAAGTYAAHMPGSAFTVVRSKLALDRSSPAHPARNTSAMAQQAVIRRDRARVNTCARYPPLFVPVHGSRAS